MTTFLRICPSCSSPIPAGSLFCAVCGASSPTEIAVGGYAASPPAIDVDARRIEVQAALGDGYQVRQLLGRGGFGEVWAVHDVALNREVAVKVLHASLAASTSYRERFRREARAIARLRHPGIVPIYHVGESRGLVYFTMPLVQGTTLKAALAAPGGVDPGEAQRILLEAASALKEAHAQGIVHRDLKPENIMLEGNDRRVLIMDFGVAKMDEHGAEGLTETDTVVGSPEYMSPEQATGRELDARSDLYSLGVVGYRMLAGRLPFRAATPREVLAHHVLSPPDPLGHRVGMPLVLTDAVMRCLAKNPLERWQTADDLLRALAGDTPPRTAAVAELARISGTLLELAPRPISGRRVAAWSLAVLGVLLLAAAPFLVVRWRGQARALAAASYASGQYNLASDSLVSLAAGFVAGDVTGPRFLELRDELLVAANERIDARYGPVLDDSARWSDSARLLLATSFDRLRLAGRDGGALSIRASDVPGCLLRVSGDGSVLRDDVPDDNCWWQATLTRSLAAPLEYFVRFRVAAQPAGDAGFGLALCRTEGECRIAFLWPRSSMIWADHRPRRGLSVIQTGRGGRLTPGEHLLRLRYQDGVLRAWLDQVLVLERATTAEAGYFERPGSLHLVVQNMAVELPGSDAIGLVGRPAGR